MWCHWFVSFQVMVLANRLLSTNAFLILKAWVDFSDASWLLLEETNADFWSLAFGLGILRAYQHVEFKMSSWDVSQFFLPTNMIGVVWEISMGISWGIEPTNINQYENMIWDCLNMGFSIPQLYLRPCNGESGMRNHKIWGTPDF